MRFEPPVDRGRLLAAVQAAYPLPVEAITFTPVGLGSACYLLHDAAGARWFLKLWPHLRTGTPAADRQEQRLILTGALHERVPAIRVPYPLPATDGRLWAAVEGMPFAVTPLLSGDHPPEPWPPALSAPLGVALASLHGATPLFADQPLAREPFTVPFEPALRSHLAAAAGLGAAARPGLLALRDWVLRRGDEVLDQIDRLYVLRETAVATPTELVLCHADLHRENLLVDATGRLALLDWDDARLAPAEHDLWYPLLAETAAVSFPLLITAYRRSGGGRLHTAHVAFYLLRRYLEDAGGNLADLLSPDADERQDGTLLHALDAWSAQYWRRLDQTLTIVSATLMEA